MGALAELAARRPNVARIATALDAALAGGRLGHAYLVFGPTGAGKADLARALAADRLKRIRHDGTHPDLVVLAPLEGKREIGIDAVRDVAGELLLAPLEAEGRMAIVEGADLLGEEAANALLKTLEEPPEGVLMVLLTARPDAVLPTIRSRCIGLRVPPSAGGAARAPFAVEAGAALADLGGDPFARAARAWQVCEQAATEGEEQGTPLEKKRRAVFAALDAATEALAARFREQARAGGSAVLEAAAVERIANAVEHMEANATPLLVLEALALDLDRGGKGVFVPRR